MKKFLVRALSWVEHGAAALFLVIAVVAATLYFGGRLNRQTALDTWFVLQGSKRAVAESDYRRWQDMEEEVKTRTRAEVEEGEGARSAREAFQSWRGEFQKQIDRERAALEMVQEVLKDRQEKLSSSMKVLETKEAKLEEDRKRFDDALQKKRLAKALKLYRGMDSELIAQDFKSKWDGSAAEEKQEVVELLRSMPDRLAGEVINAITDSTTRIAIMKAIKEPEPEGNRG